MMGRNVTVKIRCEFFRFLLANNAVCTESGPELPGPGAHMRARGSRASICTDRLLAGLCVNWLAHVAGFAQEFPKPGKLKNSFVSPVRLGSRWYAGLSGFRFGKPDLLGYRMRA